jgi:hypothetical protein
MQKRNSILISVLALLLEYDMTKFGDGFVFFFPNVFNEVVEHLRLSIITSVYSL